MSKKHRCIIIGAGGIGTWLGEGLVRPLEYQAPGSQLLILDGDSFEVKNAARQKFSRLGPKAQVMRNDLAEKFPKTIIMARVAWVVSEEEGKTSLDELDELGVGKIAPSQFLKEYDHVFVVVDNHAARKIVFDAARSFNNIDVYTGGNGDDLSGSIYHYCRRGGIDITMHPGEIHDEMVNPPDKNPGSMSCEERAKIEGGQQILAANLTVAAMLLAKASMTMFGTDEQARLSLKSNEIFFDWSYGKARPYEWTAEEGEKESSTVPEAALVTSQQ